jgi:hypothetical protein
MCLARATAKMVWAAGNNDVALNCDQRAHGNLMIKRAVWLGSDKGLEGLLSCRSLQGTASRLDELNYLYGFKLW